MENKPAARKRRSFTDEFKKDAAGMVIDDGRAINDVAKALGVGSSTLGVWVRQEGINRGTLEGLTTASAESELHAPHPEVPGSALKTL